MYMYYMTMLLAICFSGVEPTEDNGNHSKSHQLKTATSQSKCPAWLYYNFQNSDCECITYYALKCFGNNAALLFGFCTMYEENINNTTVVSFSACPYFVTKGYNLLNSDYVLLPKNLSTVNDYMCEPMNRKGRMCSECVDGFGPAITSPGYRIPCRNCTSNWSGVPLYLVLEFVPVTVFYLIILFLQISMTMAPMTCFIMYCQFVALVIDLVYDIVETELSIKIIFTLDEHSKLFLKVILTVLDFWNLRFFRYLLPPFCVSSRLKAIHVILLGYVSAFYPFFLVFLTWCFVNLHDNNFRPFVCLWRPFHKCFVKLRRSWDAKSDIIDVFATFFLLSFTRVMSQTAYLLIYHKTDSYSVINGSHIGTSLFAAADQSIPLLSSEHVAFIIPAVFIFLVFNVLPTLLLLLYPIGMFRACLSKCRLDGIALGIFVEKFYSCYRDGLDGGKDMRSFAALYFFTRLFLFIANLIASLLNVINGDIWLPFGIVLSVTLVLMATLRPYKKTYMNNLDTILLIYLALLTHMLSACHHGFHLFAQTLELMMVLPIACFFILGAWRVIQRIRETKAFHCNSLLHKWQHCQCILIRRISDSQIPADESFCAEQRPLLSPRQA